MSYLISKDQTEVSKNSSRNEQDSVWRKVIFEDLGVYKLCVYN